MSDSAEQELQRLMGDLRDLMERVAKPLPTVLTKKRAAEELSISSSTLKKMIRGGQIQTVTIEKTVMVPSSEVRRLATPKLPASHGKPDTPRKEKRAASPKRDAARLRDMLKHG